MNDDIARRLRNWEAGAFMRPALYDEAADELERLRAEVATLMDGMERAWGIIANGRAWDPVHHDEWEAAKFAWRDDHWHPSLARNVSGDAPEQGGDR